MPRLPDEYNPAKIDLPPEMAELLAAYERRITALETALAELQRAPWAADIAAVRNAIPTWSTLSGKPSTFAPAMHGNEAHSLTFITGVAWADVTGKPSTFAPSSHGNEAHTSTFITGVAWADVTSKPTTFTPADHGNEAHTPDFSAKGHTHPFYDFYTLTDYVPSVTQGDS